MRYYIVEYEFRNHKVEGSVAGDMIAVRAKDARTARRLAEQHGDNQCPRQFEAIVTKCRRATKSECDTGFILEDSA